MGNKTGCVNAKNRRNRNGFVSGGFWMQRSSRK